MSRTTAHHVTVIRCDSPVCPTVGGARFMTASIAAMARLQARDANWQRLPAWTVTDDDSPRRKYDICPAEAPRALERKARRSEIFAEQRKAQKQQRELEKHEQRARRAADRQAKRERLAAEKRSKQEQRLAERERRAAERSQRKATRGDEQTEAAPLVDETAEGEFADDGTWRSVEDPSVQAEKAAANSRPSRKRRSGQTTVLDVIERILRVRGAAMSVADIVGHAIGDLALPTMSKTPKTIVARDLAIDIKSNVHGSRFVRIMPGVFMLREHWENAPRVEGERPNMESQ